MDGRIVIAAPGSVAEESRPASELERGFFCLSRASLGDFDLPYQGFWLRDGAKGTTDSFVVERVLAETPDWVAERFPFVASFNLQRWKLSSYPENWVQAHLQGWSHQDWLDMLASLRKIQFWPMEESAVGRHLESLRVRIVGEKVRYLLSVEEPVVYPDDLKDASRDEPAFCGSNLLAAARSFGTMQSEARARLERAAAFPVAVLRCMAGLPQKDLANLAQNAASKTVRAAASRALSANSSANPVGNAPSSERR